MTIPQSSQTVHLMRWRDILRVRRDTEIRNKLELHLHTTDDLRRLYQVSDDNLIKLRDGVVTRTEVVAEVHWRVFWSRFGYSVVLVMTVIAAVASVVAAVEGYR